MGELEEKQAKVEQPGLRTREIRGCLWDAGVGVPKLYLAINVIWFPITSLTLSPEF